MSRDTGKECRIGCAHFTSLDAALAYRSYLGLLRQGDVDEHRVYEAKARKIAIDYGLPLEPINQAVRDGARRRFENLIRIIEEGGLTYFGEAREWADEYGFSYDRIEEAKQKGLMGKN